MLTVMRSLCHSRRHALLLAYLLLLCIEFQAEPIAPSQDEALLADDECKWQPHDPGVCALNAIQLARATQTLKATERVNLAHPGGEVTGAIPNSSEWYRCDVEEHKAMFFTSDGLSNTFLEHKFAYMIATHFKARPRDKDGILKLKTWVMWDSCFLKESVWNKDWRCAYEDLRLNFTSEHNANYVSLRAKTNSSLFGETTISGIRFEDLQSEGWRQTDSCAPHGMRLAPYWCEDFGQQLRTFKQKYNIEFEIHPISLIDTFASDFLKRALAELTYRSGTQGVTGGERFWQKLKDEIRELPIRADFADMLADVDVVALDGGNPDVTKFATAMFAPAFAKALEYRVRMGKTVFLGRSAGAMNGGKELVTITNPNLWEVFMGNDHKMQGMGLMGRCAIRPHWRSHWRSVLLMFQVRTLTDTEFVPLRNGEAVACQEGTCSRYRIASLDDSDRLGIGHVATYARSATRFCSDDIGHERKKSWDECQTSLGVAAWDSASCVNMWRECFLSLKERFCERLVHQSSKWYWTSPSKRVKLLEQCLAQRQNAEA